MNRIAKTLLGLISLVAVSTFAADLKYSVVPNYFEQEPEGKSLGPCHGGVVIDQAGNIYVSTDTDRGIVVYSAKGKFLRAFGPTAHSWFGNSQREGRRIYLRRASLGS